LLWLSPAAGAPGQLPPPLQVLSFAGVAGVSISGTLVRANFGGLAAGPDVLTVARNPLTTVIAPLAIVRAGPTTAHRVFLPQPMGVLTFACNYVPMQIDGVGPDEVLAICPDSMGFLHFQYATVVGSGATLTFSGWQTATAPPLAGGYALPVPNEGDPRLFLLVDDKLTVVTATAGALSIDVHPTSRQLDVAVLAKLSGAAVPDLVGYAFDVSSVLVLRWNGTTWAEVQRLGTGGSQPLGVAVVSPMSAPDVLVGSVSGPEVQFLENDAGVLR